LRLPSVGSAENPSYASNAVTDKSSQLDCGRDGEVNADKFEVGNKMYS